jgi:hypothetical protein
MRFYTSIAILSLLTISICVDFSLLAYGSTTLLHADTSSQLLAATQGEHGENKAPDPGAPRRQFYRSQELVTPQLS